MVPLFLAEIEGYLALALTERANPTPLVFFIFHLLGEWREKSPYGWLAASSIPSHGIEVVLGDAITTNSHRVGAAICDGDTEPLYEIILDPRPTNSFGRGCPTRLPCRSSGVRLTVLTRRDFSVTEFGGISPAARSQVASA
jgi:hypothetical protein